MTKNTALGMGLGLLIAIVGAGCGGAPEPPATPSSPATPDSKAAEKAGGEKDTDGDGIPDTSDKCPDKKEDGQAPDPKDGCPKAN